MAYKLECTECGSSKVRNSETDETFCDNCSEVRECEVVSEPQRYTVIIEVDGSIDHEGHTMRVSGVTGREVYAENEDKAKDKAVRDFRENPDYNTDISVNKKRFPDGRYLDDWGYNSSTAQAIDAVPAEDLSPISVKWRQRGRRYCEWESKY